MARFRLHWFLPVTVELRAVASPQPCCVSAHALKALRATTGTVSPQPGQISPRGTAPHPLGPLVSDGAEGGHTLPWEMSESSQPPWFEAWIYHQVTPFMDLEEWIPCSCSCFSIQRHNRDSSWGWWVPALCHIHPVKPRHEGFRASRTPAGLLQRGYEQVTHSSAHSWPSTGHQIHHVSLKPLVGCPQCT